MDEDEKTYKCSDCDEWITATEECCGEEKEQPTINWEKFFVEECGWTKITTHTTPTLKKK